MKRIKRQAFLVLILAISAAVTLGFGRIGVDNNDADWQNINNVWTDPNNDAGGGSRDITEVRITSDDSFIYFFYRVATVYSDQPYPEVKFYLDTDLNGATGNVAGIQGCEVAVTAAGKGIDGGPALYYDKGQGMIWSLASDAIQPEEAGHGRNFAEAYLRLSDLGLENGQTVRFIAQSMYSGDWLQGYTVLASSSLTCEMMTFEKDTWTDPNNDAGGSSRDLVEVRITSDTTNLKLYFKMAVVYDNLPYPEMRVYLDTDLNAATGNAQVVSGCDLYVVVAGKGSDGGPALGYDKGDGSGIIWLPGAVVPNQPNHGQDWFEGTIPLAQIGIDIGQPMRFFAVSQYVNDWLAGYTTISSSDLFHRTYDYRNNLYVDRTTDGGGSSRDLAEFLMTTDENKIAFFFKMAVVYDNLPYPEMRIYFDTDVNAATGNVQGVPGCDLYVVVAGKGIDGGPAVGYDKGLGLVWATNTVVPSQAGHGANWFRATITLSELGLTKAQTVRYIVKSQYVDDFLKGYSSLSTSKLYSRVYNNTVYLGAVVFNLDDSGSDNLIQDYKNKLMDGRSFKAGVDFDVQLAIHGEDGTTMLDYCPTAYGQRKYEKMRKVLERMKKYNIAYAPLLNYHYMPSWLVSKHINDYGKDPRSIDYYTGLPPTDPTNYMVLSPDSPATKVWTMEMAGDVTKYLKPYLRTVVPAVFVGNEVMYKPNTTYDDYTRDEWRIYVNDPTAVLPVPDNITPNFVTFRSLRMKNMFANWNSSVANQVYDLYDLNTPVCTKLFPYSFYAGDAIRAGYLPEIYDYIESQNVGTIVGDYYPPEPRVLSAAYRKGKSMIMSEFGSGTGSNTATSPTSAEVANWAVFPVEKYNVRSAFFFSWNGASPKFIFQEQINGLRNAINTLTTANKPADRTVDIQFLVPYPGNWVYGNLDMMHPDQIYFLEGLRLAAGRNHMNYSTYAVEMDTEQRSEPAVSVERITVNRSIPLADILNKKRIYSLGPNVTITMGSYNVKTASLSQSNSSSTVVVTDLETLSAGDRVMTWSPDWVAGNKGLTTTYTGTKKTIAKTYSNNKPTVLQIGKTIFMANDIFWIIGSNDTTYNVSENATRLVSELIHKLEAGLY